MNRCRILTLSHFPSPILTITSLRNMTSTAASLYALFQQSSYAAHIQKIRIRIHIRSRERRVVAVGVNAMRVKSGISGTIAVFRQSSNFRARRSSLWTVNNIHKQCLCHQVNDTNATRPVSVGAFSTICHATISVLIEVETKSPVTKTNV